MGEGEETFHELAGYYIERKPETLSGIRGVAFRDETKAGILYTRAGGN